MRLLGALMFVGYLETVLALQHVVTHFRVWGPIHNQLRDLPDGAQVEFRVEE
jgi:hypothetical protein